MPFEENTGEDTADMSLSPSDDAASPDAGAGTPDVTPPPSSGSEPEAPGKTDDDAQSLEDVINAALDAPDAPPADDGGTDDKAPDADAPSEEPAPKDGPADDPETVSEEEISRYGKNAQKRIRQLLDVRADLRKQLTAAETDAGSYQQIRSFMATNRLEDAEVVDLFRIGADIKSGDPTRLAAFLDRVMPLVQHAMIATGRVLPQDLQTQVENGDMTEDAARSMSQTRTQAAFAQQQAQVAQQQVAQTQTQVAQGQIVFAVNQWQEQARAADPDFDMKAQAMHRIAQALVAERGLPQTPAQAVEYAKLAYAEAGQLIKAARPAPKATRPAPSSQQAPRSGLSPTPTSLEAIINQALGG